MWKSVSLFVLCACLAQSVFSWTGFYTTEYPQYSIAEQTISVVFTLEAPFKIVKKAPLSLSSVLDTSGSMEGRGIDLLRATTQFLALKLAEDGGLHDVGLVTYDSSVAELSPVVPMTASNAELLSFFLGNVVASGKTFLSAGLNLGVEQQATAPYGKVKSVYLFSDGLPNVGATSQSEIVGAVDNLLASTNEYISISTFGMGNQIDYSLLTAIAERGGGDAYLIRRPEDIPIAFGKALGGLTTIVGTEIEVVFTTFPGCRIKSVATGGIYSESSYTVSYDNLYAGELREILFEVELGVAPIGFEKCLQTDYYYVDAVTRERLSGGSFVLDVERDLTGPAAAVPAYRVEENRLKFLVADACLFAQRELREGNKQSALQSLISAKEALANSAANDSPVIVALLVDIDVLIVEVEDDQEEEVLKVGTLGGFAKTLKTGRSVLVSKKEFEIEKQVETEEQKSVKEELVDKVFNSLGLDPNAIPDQSGDDSGANGDGESQEETEEKGETDGETQSDPPKDEGTQEDPQSNPQTGGETTGIVLPAVTDGSGADDSSEQEDNTKPMDPVTSSVVMNKEEKPRSSPSGFSAVQDPPQVTGASLPQQQVSEEKKEEESSTEKPEGDQLAALASGQAERETEEETAQEARRMQDEKMAKESEQRKNAETEQKAQEKARQSAQEEEKQKAETEQRAQGVGQQRPREDEQRKDNMATPGRAASAINPAQRAGSPPPPPQQKQQEPKEPAPEPTGA